MLASVSENVVTYFVIYLIFRLGSSPELTGPVAMPALMGAPVIDLEKLFNGQETTSALQAVQAILFNGNKIKERDVAVGIRIAENVEDLMSQETEVWKTGACVTLMFRKMFKTQVRIANKDFRLQSYFGEARDVVILWKSCLILSFFLTVWILSSYKYDGGPL